METTTTTRVVGYLRVSTDEQAESGLGLDAQRATIEAAAAARGWEVVAFHTDAGVSGGVAPAKRPAFAAALAAMEAGEADVLVVAKGDRLARSVVALVDLIDEAERVGWSLVTLDTDVDTSTAAGRMVASMMGVIAEWERRIVSERTKGAMRAAKARGVRMGGPVVLPQSARERVAALRAEGLTLQAVADTLTAEGVPTARGGQWHRATVRHVLRSLDLDAEATAARAAA